MDCLERTSSKTTTRIVHNKRKRWRRTREKIVKYKNKGRRVVFSSIQVVGIQKSNVQYSQGAENTGEDALAFS